MTAAAPVLATRDLGPATEREVARDILRHGLYIVPIALAIGAIGWGWAGVASIGLAVGVVLLNFWLSAALLAWAARISLGLLMGVALFGFLIRLGLISAVFLSVRHDAWVRPMPLCIALVVTHLGLLVWETRYVSASLAFPGLAPRGDISRPRAAADTSTDAPHSSEQPPTAVARQSAPQE